MRGLTPGAVFTYEHEDNQSFRILASNQTLTYSIMLDDSTTGVPREHLTEDLIKEINEGILIETPDIYQRIVDDNELTLKQVKLRDKRYEIIKDLWNNEEQKYRLLLKGERKKAYEEISEKLGVSTTSVRTILNQFFKGGMTRNSLIPQFRKRGGSSKTHDGDFKPGRRPENINGEVQGIKITNQEREQFREGYEKVYLSKKDKSLNDAYKYILAKYYSRENLEDNGQKRLEVTREVPTFRQFYYWVQKNRDLEQEERIRGGDNAYDNNQKVDQGSLREKIRGPGQRAEIDATHLNISVVAEYDRNKIIGRPIMYTLMDVYSRMIMGVYIGIENESWRTTALTLLNAVEDKVSFAAKYGIGINEADWPAHYLPLRLVGDRGALYNPRITDVSHSVGMNVKFIEAYMPVHKPGIENRHKGFKDYIQKNLPGADRKDSGQRGAPDYREEACMTLDELRGILIDLIVEFNHSLISDYPSSPEMLANKVSPTPVELWNWGVERGESYLIKVTDPQELRYHLLRETSRVVSDKGIKLNNFYYVGMDRRAQHFLNIKNQSTSKRVKILYNEADVTEVYVKEDGEYYPLKIKNNNQAYQGMSLKESKQYFNTGKSLDREKQLENLISEIELDRRTEEKVKEARKYLPESRAERRKRLKNISENKKEYIQNEYKKESEQRHQRQESEVKEPVTKEAEPKRKSFDERRKEFIEERLKNLNND